MLCVVSLIVGAIFTVSLTSPDKPVNEPLSTQEIQPENELLSFLQVLIKEKLKGVDEVGVITSGNDDSIIIETSIHSSDIEKQLALSDQLFAELRKMNSQNGINRTIDYTVVLKTEDEIVVGELKFGDHPPDN